MPFRPLSVRFKTIISNALENLITRLTDPRYAKIIVTYNISSLEYILIYQLNVSSFSDVYHLRT